MTPGYLFGPVWHHPFGWFQGIKSNYCPKRPCSDNLTSRSGSCPDKGSLGETQGRKATDPRFLCDCRREGSKDRRAAEGS